MQINYFPAQFFVWNGATYRRKPTVPLRVQSYIDGGLHKDLIDPDTLNPLNIIQTIVWACRVWKGEESTL